MFEIRSVNVSEGGGTEFLPDAITISANYVLCRMDKGGVIESITTLSPHLEK